MCIKNNSELSILQPWAQNFTWLWYNDKEIFEDTQQDFDRRAQELANRGITMVLTFSLTHFRFGYYPYWDEINECIRKMTIACHKVGIRIVEHQSTHLTLNLTTKSGWERFDSDLQTYGNRESSYDHWKKIFPFLVCEPKINGYDLLELVQIDGRTGKPAENQYGAYSLCFNNPEYRKIYFNSLRPVVETGIDGIMNDDVQYFGYGNACTCKYCRAKFREETGYELPEPAQWSEFFEHYENPAYVAWKRFKFESTERFYRDLGKLYEQWGLRLIRPNYSSNVLDENTTSYSFDRCCDQWDFIFQENCFSAIVKQSYLNFMTEAVHRYAAAQRTGVPSMSMFYPNRADIVYFGWALARSWGQLYNGTFEGFDTTVLEKPYRDFEKAHLRFYSAPKKLTDLSFYFSINTRDFAGNAAEQYMWPFMGQMQACYISGLGVNMVFDTDDACELAKHSRIVVSHAAVMSDKELQRLSDYAKNGGQLIFSGAFAIWDEHGTLRTEEERKDLFEGRLPETGEIISFGKGTLTSVESDGSREEYQPTIWSQRHISGVPKPAKAVPSRWNLQKSNSGARFRQLIQHPWVQTDCENERIAVTAFCVENGIALHLINLMDTISEQAVMVSHEDHIVNFCGEGTPVGKITITLRKTGTIHLQQIKLSTPEKPESLLLHWQESVDDWIIEVPKDSFSGYALIEME